MWNKKKLHTSSGTGSLTTLTPFSMQELKINSNIIDHMSYDPGKV